MQGCSLVQAKLWLETTTTTRQVSMKIMGPLASTKEHQHKLLLPIGGSSLSGETQFSLQIGINKM